MVLETLKITESGLEYYVREKVPSQMGTLLCDFELNGGYGWTRTTDLSIMSAAL